MHVKRVDATIYSFFFVMCQSILSSVRYLVLAVTRVAMIILSRVFCFLFFVRCVIFTSIVYLLLSIGLVLSIIFSSISIRFLVPFLNNRQLNHLFNLIITQKLIFARKKRNYIPFVLLLRSCSSLYIRFTLSIYSRKISFTFV